MLFNKKPDSSEIHPVAAETAPPANLRATDRALVASRPQGGTGGGTATQSVIDAWLNISGNLQSEGDVRVDGRICGDIRCAHLVVGREATVVGHIVAEEAVVRGRVKGTIRANRVVLQDTACVESDIFHKVLSVDEGAEFDGLSCHRTDPFQDQEPTAQARAAKKRKGTAETAEGNGVGTSAAAVAPPDAESLRATEA
jgi:cytoskeletal protein CcmA (bactofilin family)